MQVRTEPQGDAALKISFPVHAVVKADGTFVSAWADIYHAKFEAERWSYDLKESWTHVPATIVLEEDDDEESAPVAAPVHTD